MVSLANLASLMRIERAPSMEPCQIRERRLVRGCVRGLVNRVGERVCE